MLRQLEVDTDRSVYIHQLNALFDDRLMVGIVRRPKKSWFFVVRTFAVDLSFIRLKDNVKHIVDIDRRCRKAKTNNER